MLGLLDTRWNILRWVKYYRIQFLYINSNENKCRKFPHMFCIFPKQLSLTGLHKWFCTVVYLSRYKASRWAIEVTSEGYSSDGLIACNFRDWRGPPTLSPLRDNSIVFTVKENGLIMHTPSLFISLIRLALERAAVSNKWWCSCRVWSILTMVCNTQSR
jgi:hypothetical protein